MKDQLASVVKMHHQHYANNGDQEAAPMLMTFNDKNEIAIFVLANFDRENGLSAIKDIVETTGATSYVFSSEAWMARVPREGNYQNMRASKDPNRVECLMVTACSPAGTISRAFEIQRHGKRADLIEMTDGETVWSRFNIYAQTVH